MWNYPKTVRRTILSLALGWVLIAAGVSAQQVVVTVAQPDVGAMRAYLESALLGELFDAGYIVWSDVPQGVWVGSRSSDARLPLQAEYAAIRHARDEGAGYLVQVNMAEPEALYESALYYSVIDVIEPQVVAAGSFVPADVVNTEKDISAQAAEAAREIARYVVPALGQDGESW